MNDLHHVALFRYGGLGPLVSRGALQRGKLKTILQELAARPYDIPGSRNTHLSEKTIDAWYYAWRRDGIEALVPKARSDRGQSKIAPRFRRRSSEPSVRIHAVPSTGFAVCSSAAASRPRRRSSARRFTACCRPMDCRARAVRRANPKSTAPTWPSTPATSGTAM